MPTDELTNSLGVFALLRLILWAGLGLVVWSMGRHMARVSCGFAGLALGGLAAIVWAEPLTQLVAAPLWASMIVAAVGACLLAWLLFRVFIALTWAALMAIAVVATLLVWQDPMMPFFHPHMAIDVIDDTATGEPPNVEGRLAHRLIEKTGNFTTWYGELPESKRIKLQIGAAISAICGLLMGLLKPLWVASVEAAMIGSVVMWSSVQYSIGSLLPGAPIWLTGLDPRIAWTHLGLLTVLGVVVQWSLSINSTDND